MHQSAGGQPLGPPSIEKDQHRRQAGRSRVPCYRRCPRRPVVTMTAPTMLASAQARVRLWRIEVRRDRRLSLSARMVASEIGDQADGFWVRVPITMMAKQIGCTTTTVSYAYADLVHYGWLADTGLGTRWRRVYQLATPRRLP